MVQYPRKRLELHEVLASALGSRNVYFQPPTNLQMKYPCIVYKRDQAVTQRADNSTYHHVKRYAVTVIDRDPDSEIPEKIAMLPMTEFSRHFVADDLNHDTYNVYF